MAIQVDYVSNLTITETMTGQYVGADSSYVVSGMNTSATLNAATTPPATKYSAFRLALSSGSGSIDLTSLPDADGAAGGVTFLGLKPRVMKLRCLSTNANAVTVAKGGTNGYTGFGASFSITLQPGDEALWKHGGDPGVADVSSSAKTLDVTGTGSQVLEVTLVAG